MRNSPSGPENPKGNLFFDGLTVQPQDFTSLVATIPGVQMGDTVAYSFDNGNIDALIPVIRIQTPGEVQVNMVNPRATPFTLNGVTIYLEVLPRG